jgi:hypothetical protein
LNIKFAERAGNAGGDWHHSSGADVSVDLNLKAALNVAGAPSGAAVVRFGKSGAFLFQSINCRTSVIENMAEVGNEIVLAYRAKEFMPTWVVVDRLVTADSATILIADSESAEIEFSANAPLGSAKSIADASLGINVKSWKGEVTRFVAASCLTPMFGASCLHKRILSAPTFGTFRGDSEDTDKNQGSLQRVPDTDWLSDGAGT